MGEKPPPHVQRSILSGDSEHLSELGKRGAEARNAAKAAERKNAAEREAAWQEIDAKRAKNRAAEDKKWDTKIAEELRKHAVMNDAGDVVHPDDLKT